MEIAMKKITSKLLLKSITLGSIMALFACNPPADESKSDQDKVDKKSNCQVYLKGPLQVGKESTANLTCQLAELYQGRNLKMTYDQDLTSLKLVSSGKETVGKKGILHYKLPKKDQFEAQLKLTGVKTGSGQVNIRVLNVKTTFKFTAVPGSPKGLTSVASTHFSKMSDSSGKAYGRSVMRLDTGQVLTSNNETICKNASVNALLVSSDHFVNCEKVYVKKGKNTNHLIIPMQTWQLDTSYKVGVKTASSVSLLAKNGVAATFTTNNANHNSSAHIKNFDAESINNGIKDNEFHLQNDGTLWMFIYLSRRVPKFVLETCRLTIDYQAKDNKQFAPFTATGATTRRFAASILGESPSHNYLIGGDNTNTKYGMLANFDRSSVSISAINTNHRSYYHYLCFVKIPTRS